MLPVKDRRILDIFWLKDQSALALQLFNASASATRSADSKL